jgi:hypothetical protein
MHKEEDHQTKFTDTKSQRKAPAKQTKSVDTHTRELMSPLILITITKGCLFNFQPQKREKLYFLNKNQRSGHHIFENSIITLLPNYPDTSKPDDLEKRVSTTRHPCHERNLNAMITNLTRSNHRDPYPIPDKKPQGR